MAKPAVIVDHLWKRYHKRFGTSTLWSFFGRRERTDDEFWAVKDISFELQPGECLGIIGPNGAGKSTLLKLLSRVTRPTRGSFALEGKLCSLIELGAGFHPELTGRENVYLNAAILGLMRRETRRKFDSIVAFAGVEDFIDVPVKRYSSGMCGRLGFSIAMHAEPRILIVDEGLSVGDLAFQQKSTESVKQLLKRQSATVLLVSHLLPYVLERCANTLWMERGCARQFGPSAEVIEQYRLSGRRDENTNDVY